MGTTMGISNDLMGSCNEVEKIQPIFEHETQLLPIVSIVEVQIQTFHAI